MKYDFKAKIAVLVCKILRVIGVKIGKGSSLPGVFALKIDKNILSKIELPKKIVAVTGSNGKTSTVEMIVNAFKANGLKVVYNSEGANQLDGVATFILSASKKGKLDYDIMVVEADEQSARHIFKFFVPTYYVINNLYRDQLSRNGHPERIFSIIKQSISDSSTLILNADDPLTASFGYNRANSVYFGVSPQSKSSKNDSAYDDGAFCPVCLGNMNYDYRLYNHMGGYSCTNCDFKRPEVKYSVETPSLKTTILCGKKINFKFSGIHNVYNMLAAFAVCSELGLNEEITRNALSDYILKNGRAVNFKIGENYGTLLVSKHENSIAYDCSIKLVKDFKKSSTVVIIVDSISRKYFTSDTSWLFDIDFEKLKLPFVNEIILAGKYCHDLAVRFSFTDINKDIITVSERIPDAMEGLKYKDTGRIFIFTCFSDKHKALSSVETLPPDFILPNPDKNVISEDSENV